MYSISYNCPNARSDCFPGNLYGQLYEIPCIIYYVLKIKFVPLDCQVTVFCFIDVNVKVCLMKLLLSLAKNS